MLTGKVRAYVSMPKHVYEHPYASAHSVLADQTADLGTPSEAESSCSCG